LSHFAFHHESRYFLRIVSLIVLSHWKLNKCLFEALSPEDVKYEHCVFSFVLVRYRLDRNGDRINFSRTVRIGVHCRTHD